MLDDLQRSADKKKVQLSLAVDPQLHVLADSDLLEQILLNLLENAIKYGSEAGKVSVHAEPDGHDQIRVSISDDGPGIPPESLERIFERFFRVDKARSRAQGGTGLGLSIVKHIAQTLGGRVWVESKMAEGTTFFFTLKASTDLSPAPNTEAAALELCHLTDPCSKLHCIGHAVQFKRHGYPNPTSSNLFLPVFICGWAPSLAVAQSKVTISRAGQGNTVAIHQSSGNETEYQLEVSSDMASWKPWALSWGPFQEYLDLRVKWRIQLGSIASRT